MFIQIYSFDVTLQTRVDSLYLAEDLRRVSWELTTNE